MEWLQISRTIDEGSGRGCRRVRPGEEAKCLSHLYSDAWEISCAQVYIADLDNVDCRCSPDLLPMNIPFSYRTVRPYFAGLLRSTGALEDEYAFDIWKMHRRRSEFAI